MKKNRRPSLWLEGLACACALAVSPGAWGREGDAMAEFGGAVAEPDRAPPRMDMPCAGMPCWMFKYSGSAFEDAWDEKERKRAIVASWPTEPEWPPSSAIVERGRGGQDPWMTGLAAAIGGYKTYDALRSKNTRRTGVGRFLGIASDRLELLPGRMGQDSGAKGVVGLSVFSCRNVCLGSRAMTKMDVSLVFNPKGENGQRQVILGAKMRFH